LNQKSSPRRRIGEDDAALATLENQATSTLPIHHVPSDYDPTDITNAADGFAMPFMLQDGHGSVDLSQQNASEAAASLVSISREDIFQRHDLGQEAPQASTAACPHGQGNGNQQTVHQHSFESPAAVPSGLLESTKFPEDMIYYHHLRDSSPYGLLSILGLTEIFNAQYLDVSLFHAALALSALAVSRSNAPEALRSKAAIHALDHFVEALGTVGRTLIDGDQNARMSKPNTMVDAHNREKAISWLATVLFMALFELQRGQMKLWYVHSCAAVDFLCQHLKLVVEVDIGEALVRSFSVISALLDIYDRTHSVQNILTNPDVSNSLSQSLKISCSPRDRLLYILPRVNELEETWRANPRNDSQLDAKVEGLRQELKEWRNKLAPRDIPMFDDEDDSLSSDDSTFEIKPFTIAQARDPVRAATNIMHYISSLVRLDFVYPPGPKRMLSESRIATAIRHICRLAAGVPLDLVAAVNAYGHGMLPVIMNMYGVTEDDRIKEWMRGWIDRFPREREGIWNISQMQRLLLHCDEEYGRHGPRAGWSVIKCRMIDLEIGGQSLLPGTDETGSEKFCVEIYARGKRGWAVDFVEID
jgi:hypothetical protein